MAHRLVLPAASCRARRRPVAPPVAERAVRSPQPPAAAAAAAAGDIASRRRALLMSLLCASASLLPLAPPVHAAPPAGDWSSPGLAKDASQPANVQRTPGGVAYEVVSTGTGAPARDGDAVLYDYVLRRANGYIITSTQPCGLPACGEGGPEAASLAPGGDLIEGLRELLVGMRAGEKRVALVPPRLGYTEEVGRQRPLPGDYGQRRQVASHKAEPLVFELRLVRVRPAAG